METIIKIPLGQFQKSTGLEYNIMIQKRSIAKVSENVE